MSVPQNPKIYHILHVDKLGSLVADQHLFCDAMLRQNQRPGTTIGMSDIKLRRLQYLTLDSHPNLYVGQCVPFYFCPRSIMLFLLHCANHPGLSYKGGQQPIVHLECDLYATVQWAEANQRRWAFTTSNAGSNYFEDRCDLADLGEINWDAVKTNRWSGQGISPQVKEGKQAEFLVERSFPWHLVERVGALSNEVAHKAQHAMRSATHRPTVQLRRDWYY